MHFWPFVMRYGFSAPNYRLSILARCINSLLPGGWRTTNIPCNTISQLGACPFNPELGLRPSKNWTYETFYSPGGMSLLSFCPEDGAIYNVSAALWARIAQNVKKPPLTVILNFLVLMNPLGSLWVPLVPKSHDTLLELFRFTRYLERNKVHLTPFPRYHWNHYIALPNFSDVWLSSR